MPDFEILVDDLARVSEDALRRRPIHPLGLTVLWALRVEYSGYDPAELGAWVEVLDRAAELGPRAGFEHVLRHLVEGERGSNLVDALTKQPLSERAREDVMSLAKKWHDEGLQEGIEKGRQEGHQEGVRAGRVEVLLRLLRRRFPSEPAASYEERVRAADLETLDRWTDQVLVGETVEDVLQ